MTVHAWSDQAHAHPLPPIASLDFSHNYAYFVTFTHPYVSLEVTSSQDVPGFVSNALLMPFINEVRGH